MGNSIALIFYKTDLADLTDDDALILEHQISSLSSNTLIGIACNLSFFLIPNCENSLFPKAYISLFDVFTNVLFNLLFY